MRLSLRRWALKNRLELSGVRGSILIGVNDMNRAAEWRLFYSWGKEEFGELR